MSSRTDQRPASPADPIPEPEGTQSGTTVTRRLAASVHLDDRACDLLRDQYRIEPHRAAAPSYAVDAIAMVGHAQSARRHQLIRDLLLLGLLGAMIVIIWKALPAEKRAATVVACAIALIAGWAVTRWIRYSLKQETTAGALRAYYREHPLGAAGDLIAVLVLLAGVLAVALATADLYSEIIMLAVFFGAAWVVVAIERYVALSLACQVRTQTPATLGAATLSAKLSEDLGRIHAPERNLIVYNSTANFYDTFVGSGRQLDTHDINIDVSIGRTDDDGVRLIPQPVDVVDLHRTLQRNLLSVGVPGCWGGHRMYVDGNNLGQIPWSEDGLFDPLDVVIDKQLVLGNLREDGSMRRTYLCIQITTWNGDLVVTLFMRATLTGTNLHVLNKIYVLAPLGFEFRQYERAIPRYWLNRLGTAIAYATQNVVPRLLHSPQRCAVGPVRLVRRDLRHRWEQWRISHGERFDHGATVSAREWFADPASIRANAWDDVVRQVHLLQTGYSAALESYLRERDIDTGSLSESMHNLHIHQATSLTIENVHNLATGKGGSAGDRHSVHHASPGSQPPAAAAGPASASSAGS
jgi:hypothetical protein